MKIATLQAEIEEIVGYSSRASRNRTISLVDEDDEPYEIVDVVATDDGGIELRIRPCDTPSS